MPRPRLEKELRKTVREYLAIAENLSVEEAPLNTLSVAPQLGFNRKTLKKYGVDVEIARASERPGRNGTDPTELWKPLSVPDRSLPRTRTSRNCIGRSASA
jgi:hypothetical protein